MALHSPEGAKEGLSLKVELAKKWGVSDGAAIHQITNLQVGKAKEGTRLI